MEAESRIMILSIENQHYNDKLNEAVENLAKADLQIERLKYKSRVMTSMVVHDLKNPLYSILGMSSGQPPGSKLEYFHETTKKMLRLVLNILDMDKHEESPLQPNMSFFDYDRLLNDVVVGLEPGLRAKSMKIIIQSSGSYQIKGDKALISRLIENLLINAIAYSDQEKPLMVNIKNEHQYLRTEIVNYGAVIPQEIQSNLFDPFVHGNNTKTLMTSTGLGLAFCKMVADLHSGKIGVESAAGQPIVFWFSLPDYASDESDEQTKERKLDFKPDFNWLSEAMQHHSELLAPLKTYEVYEMSRIIGLLRQFLPDPDDPATRWKDEIEQAVYQCDNIRYKELAGLIGPPENNENRRT